MTTRKQFAAQINSAWRKTIAAIIETGRLLIAAKDALGHGEFLPMIADDLPFGEETAQRLMKIAKHERLSNSSNWRYLPPYFRTLSELARLPVETFDRWLDQGFIHPDMTYGDAAANVAIRIKEQRNEEPRHPPKDVELIDSADDEIVLARTAYFAALKSASRARLSEEFQHAASLFTQMLAPVDERVAQRMLKSAVQQFNKDNVCAMHINDPYYPVVHLEDLQEAAE